MIYSFPTFTLRISNWQMCAIYSFLISLHTIPTAVASFQGGHIFDNPVKIKNTPQTASLTIAFDLWVQLSTFFPPLMY